MMKRRIIIIGSVAVFLGIALCLGRVMDIAMHVSLGEASELPDFPGMGRSLHRMALFVGLLAAGETAMLLWATWQKKKSK